MSIILTLSVIAMLIGVFAQLGARLSARQSVVWVLSSIFLLVALIKPEALQFITTYLGVHIVSNFVFAALIFFLFLQAISQQVETTTLSKKLRSAVVYQAVEGFNRRSMEGKNSKSNILIVVPCFNEEENIRNTVEVLSKIKAQNETFDFCIVNDGSIDETENILKKIAPSNYTTHGSNIGVAGVLMTGFHVAIQQSCEYVVQFDADGQHPADSIVSLVEEARKRKTDLLIGSRFCSGGTSLESTSVARRIGGYIITLTLWLFGRSAGVTDPTSGFRVYSKKAFLYLAKNMCEEYPEPESIAQLSLQKMSIQETYVKMQERQGGESSLAGLKSLRFMTKVVSALVGLKLRSVFL